MAYDRTVCETPNHVRTSDTPLWGRLAGTLTELGVFDGVLYLLARAVERLTRGRLMFRKYYFLAQPVAEASMLGARRGKAFAVRAVDRDDPIVACFPRPADVIARRFSRGSTCFVATKGTRFAGFLWLQAGSYEEDEVRCRFTPQPASQTVWDYDVHVEPEHRASFAFACLWEAAYAHCRASGVKWSMSRVSAFNAPSLRAHRRLNAAIVASACYVKGRRWQLMLSGIEPHVHFSTRDEHAPELSLSADRVKRRE
jgi:hypothetical protein